MSEHRSDYSAAQIMAAISAALKAGDMQAAADLTRMLAVKDPTSAQMILDAVEFLSPAQPDGEASA